MRTHVWKKGREGRARKNEGGENRRDDQGKGRLFGGLRKREERRKEGRVRKKERKGEEKVIKKKWDIAKPVYNIGESRKGKCLVGIERHVRKGEKRRERKKEKQKTKSDVNGEKNRNVEKESSGSEDRKGEEEKKGE